MEANLPAVRTFGIIPKGIEEAIRLSNIMSCSGLMPKSITTPEAVFVAMQMGAEIGLSPMASVQNIAVINGRPGIYGDAALAVVRASGQLEEFKEWSDGARKTPAWTFFCRIKRKGFEPVIGAFTWAEACEAGYDRADNQSPWKKWTNRMMQFKARNFVMRDQFTDYLKGIRTIEDNMDAIDLEISMSTEGQQQYQAKSHGSSEMSGSGKIDDNAFDMLAFEKYPDGQEKLSEFVDLTAKANGASVDELKTRAVGNWSEFIKAFEAWLSKQASAKKEPANEKEIPAASETTAPVPAQDPASTPTPQGPPSDAMAWDDFRNKFINLKGAGFSTFVHTHLTNFKNCPMPIKMEAIAKWDKLYPNTLFPLNKPSATPIDQHVAPPTAYSQTLPTLAPDPTNENRPHQEVAIPISYSKEYKTLMYLKNQFPEHYIQAKQELDIQPDTISNCLNLLAMVNRKVDEANAEPKNEQPYEPPISDTSGF